MFSFSEKIPEEFDYSHTLINFLQHGNALGEALLEAMPHPILIINEKLEIIRTNRLAKTEFNNEDLAGESLNSISKDFHALGSQMLKLAPQQKTPIGSWTAMFLFEMDNKKYFLIYR